MYEDYLTIKNNWQLNEVLNLFNMKFNDLLFIAHNVHRKNFNPNEIQLSQLLSIKTGSCPEDCKYCPQSAHYNTDIVKEKLMDIDNILNGAKEAKASGSTRFCMGIAWREIKDRDLPKLVDIISKVKETGLELCVTAGMITKEQGVVLKDAGLDFYNHNIDSSEEFYPNIITTRCFQERIDTLDNIKESGLKTCSGGIIGLGESITDRANMLITLANRETHPESVPINLLVPVTGTPLAEAKKIDSFDFVKVIAIARILMPKSYVRLSAGRMDMNEQTQALCFFAGANSIFYGNKLLTTPNPKHNDDQNLLDRLGISYQAA